MYDPIIGRWLEQDPIGLDAEDMNLYRVEGNNPINTTDPTGLAPKLKAPPQSEDLQGNIYGDWQIKQNNEFGRTAPYHSHVKITFSPRKIYVSSGEIAYVQIVRVLNKDRKAITGEGSDKVDKRLTKSGWAVDRQARKFGWYGYNDNGKPSGKTAGGVKDAVVITPVTPGCAPDNYRKAVLEDVPSDVTLGKGGRLYSVTWEFQTYAIAKTGRDKGRVYGGISWGFTVDSLGLMTSSKRAFIDIPTLDFRDAIAAWDAQANDPNVKNRTNPNQVPLGTVISRFPFPLPTK